MFFWSSKDLADKLAGCVLQSSSTGESSTPVFQLGEWDCPAEWESSGGTKCAGGGVESFKPAEVRILHRQS